MLDDVTVSNFRGIYMPYVIYNYKANSTFFVDNEWFMNNNAIII